jgi:hypothetical protein
VCVCVCVCVCVSTIVEPGSLEWANLTLRTPFGAVAVRLTQSAAVASTRRDGAGRTDTAPLPELRVAIFVCSHANARDCAEKTALGSVLAVPTRVCLPPPHGVEARDAPSLLDASSNEPLASVVEGRFLCASLSHSAVLARRRAREFESSVNPHR